MRVLGIEGFFILASVTVESKIEVKLNPRWKEVRRALADVTQIAARNVETKAKEKCPYDTGATRDSIEARDISRERMIEWTVGPTTFYAPFLEYGTSKMAARPYLTPAIEKERPRLTKAIEEILERLN